MEANRTAKRHREFVRDRLGVAYDSAEVRGIAETAIRAAAQTKDNPADLINVALEELVRKGRELPGYTTLDKMVAKIRTEVNGKVFTAVAARITPAQRTRLTELLRVDPSKGWDLPEIVPRGGHHDERWRTNGAEPFTSAKITSWLSREIR